MKIWKIATPIVVVSVSILLFTVYGCESSPPGVAQVKEQMTSEQLELGDPIANSLGIVLVPIPAGEFQMGTHIPKKKRNDQLKAETPKHLVKITRPFYIAACEVTQEQYEKVMGERPWEGKPLVKESSHYAASYVTWKKAVEFCEKLSQQENQEYRLPTEAEWEYACRAGTTTAYSFGKDGKELGEYGWYMQNSYKAGEPYPHAIGQKIPNAWSLYDMHGNVWEWCQDKFGGYNGKKKVTIDPVGPKKGRLRVWRGGGFAESAGNVRSATRLRYGQAGYQPEYTAGFRVVRKFPTAE